MANLSSIEITDVPDRDQNDTTQSQEWWRPDVTARVLGQENDDPYSDDDDSYSDDDPYSDDEDSCSDDDDPYSDDDDL